MNIQRKKITSAEEARRLLGPKSQQLTDGEVITLVNKIIALYKDYSQNEKSK